MTGGGNGRAICQDVALPHYSSRGLWSLRFSLKDTWPYMEMHQAFKTQEELCATRACLSLDLRPFHQFALVHIRTDLQYCKTVRTCPSRGIRERATDNDTPGLVAPRAFCKFSDWGMSELICITSQHQHMRACDVQGKVWHPHCSRCSKERLWSASWWTPSSSQRGKVPRPDVQEGPSVSCHAGAEARM